MLRTFAVVQTRAPGRSAEARRLGRFLALARMWRQRKRTRQGLIELDARLLRDIGLTESEAMAESAMPFWKPFVWLPKD